MSSHGKPESNDEQGSQLVSSEMNDRNADVRWQPRRIGVHDLINDVDPPPARSFEEHGMS